MINQKEYSDIIITYKSVDIFSHKIILWLRCSANNDVRKQLESNVPKIELPGISSLPGLKKFIYFLYTDEILHDKLSDEEVLELKELSKIYCLEKLENLLSGKNCLESAILKNAIGLSKFTDATLIFSEEDSIQVHKSILCNRSPYFKEFFSSGLTGSNPNLIEIKECNYNSFQIILKWMYTDELEIDSIDEDTILSIIGASSFYMLTKLFNLCIKFLMKNVTKKNLILLSYVAEYFENDIIIIDDLINHFQKEKKILEETIWHFVITQNIQLPKLFKYILTPEFFDQITNFQNIYSKLSEFKIWIEINSEKLVITEDQDDETIFNQAEENLKEICCSKLRFSNQYNEIEKTIVRKLQSFHREIKNLYEVEETYVEED